MKYEVIRQTKFMGMIDTENEGDFDTYGDAERHISKAKEQEREIMGTVISQFNIVEKK